MSKMLYNPVSGEPFGVAPDIYREKYPGAVWRHNPWTGLARDSDVVRGDPSGVRLEANAELHALPETRAAMLRMIQGTYSWALLMMQAGHRLRLRSWRTKGTWVMLVMDEIYYTAHPSMAVRELARRLHVPLSKQSTFVYFTKDRNFHYGWLATHCVQLSTEWEIVPEGE